MDNDELTDVVRRHVDRQSAMIGELNQQIAEKDAKIADLERRHAALRELSEYNDSTWRELLSATGCTYHEAALDWIRRHRAAEASEQPDTPDDGELVPWDATTRPRGVVMFRSNYIDQHIERTLIEWSRVDARVRGWGLLSFADLLRSWEWSHDGITWQPCGVRKAVRS